MQIQKKLLVLTFFLTFAQGSTYAQSPEQLNDLEIAHVAYTADNIDIRYAHLALAMSSDPDVHKFAQTMIRDHTAVNVQALALLKKLNVDPQDNVLSQTLQKNAAALFVEMSQLRGKAFDKRYTENELAYHQAVNKLVEFSFIPNIENVEVKELFQSALSIFKVHEKHAEMIVSKIQ